MPSGTTVEVLCGQPEQKYGMRCAMSRVSAAMRSGSFDPCKARCDVVVAVIFQQPLADADRDVVGIERALDRK